jgi:hypothetical protein
MHAAASPLVRSLAIGLAALAAIDTASAQCSQFWGPGYGIAGVAGYVRAMVRWDPDGTGPAPAVLVLAGNFGIAGTSAANRIAVFDPATATFAPLGGGIGQEVWCLAAGPQGQLYAGGNFVAAGGLPAAGVAQWTGLNWAPLGSGLGGPSPAYVYALVVRPNGNVVVGGDFATAGGQPQPWLAQWNGSAWSGIGAGVDGGVSALANAANGDLLVGGWFQQAGGQPASGCARWNGTAWLPLGVGPGGASFAIAEAPNGDVIAAGQFAVFGTIELVRRWNGSTWSSLGNGLIQQAIPSQAFALAIAGNGDVCVGGDFLITQPFSSVQYRNVARWNGSTWTSLEGGLTFALIDWPGLGLVAGGGGGVGGGRGVAVHDGTDWQPLGRGIDAPVRAVAWLRNGGELVAGDFVTCGGVAARGIARIQAGVTTALGTGLTAGGGPASVRAVLERANGELTAAGRFDAAGGAAANNIARWNGTAWSAFGAGLGNPSLGQGVNALAELANGDLVAGGPQQVGLVTRWNGSQWQSLNLPFAGPSSVVHALLRRANGNLVAAGEFLAANGMTNIASWNGTTWQPLAIGLDGPVYALAELLDGSLLAGGDFQFAGATFTSRMARWDGASWGPFPAGASAISQPNLAVRALTVQPDGSVLVGGDFTWPARHFGTARLAGGFASCSQPGSAPDGRVSALAAGDSGRVLVGGEFLEPGSGSSCFGRFLPLFPAGATSYGSGCSGSAGPVTLSAVSLPWVGGTYRARSTGIPGSALVLDVLSTATSNTPLNTILPQALPGCTLLALPELLTLVVPSGGSALSQLVVPPAVVFLGVPLRQQHIVLELGSNGIQALSASNGLTVVAGSL